VKGGERGILSGEAWGRASERTCVGAVSVPTQVLVDRRRVQQLRAKKKNVFGRPKGMKNGP